MCRAGLLVVVRDGFLLLAGRAIGRCIFRDEGGGGGGGGGGVGGWDGDLRIV